MKMRNTCMSWSSDHSSVRARFLMMSPRWSSTHFSIVWVRLSKKGSSGMSLSRIVLTSGSSRFIASCRVRLIVGYHQGCPARSGRPRPLAEFRSCRASAADVALFEANGQDAVGNDERTRFVAVLGITPAVSAETAVRVQIVMDFKKGNR